MKLNHLFIASALMLGATSSALADGSNVYITGSSAFRGALMAYLRGKLTNTRASFDKPVDNADLTKSVDSSSFIVMSGNFNGSPNVTTFYFAFTGSVSGIRDVAGSGSPQNFPVLPGDFFTNSAYVLGTAAPFGGVKGTTANTDGTIGSTSVSVNPDFGFSDVFQSSTTYTGAMNDTQVAVLPFVWITAPGGAAAGITNMTPQIAQPLFKTGRLPLALFTGNSSDSATRVFAVGRTDDSGTRLTAMAESGVGVSAGLKQYFPVGNPVTSYSLQNNSGYVSGGNLSTAMKSTTNATGGYAVAYVGVSDAEATTGATVLSHNGVSIPTTLTTDSTTADAAVIAAVTQGKYTFWSYEHLIDSQTLSGDAAAVLANLKSNLAGSVTSNRRTINLNDMKCGRATDGDIVFHD